MADVPHFDLPFRLHGSSFAEVEQDSMDDIANCVHAAIRTPTGFRKEIPTFGTTDMTLQPQPVTTEEVIDQIGTHEDRANTIMEQHPNYLNKLIAEVTAKVSPREEDSLE